MEEYIRIGKTGAAHALLGELKLQVERAFEEAVEEIEVLFIEQKGQKLPYFVDYYRGGNMLLVKLEGLDERQSAELLANKALYLRRSDLPPSLANYSPSDELRYAFLEGFAVWEEQLGEIGLLESVEAYPQQEMAILRCEGGKEALIPLNKHFIVSIDKPERKVLMRLPEGLLDL